ncbi:hypothetical protein SELMODRAFT_419107 [Selaginella moellendorffii]|uniref:Uncharacterized protein n=1 Tax=Selaginella moellendorffii TaxID=88036 RepID=D8S7V4_SELML|nr:hypothetical protein SELMODRAFT_419107 [Selaginella moellendorffii]
MEDGVALWRERERRKLFWTDVNVIRAFFSWLRGYGGGIFQDQVHALYRHCGIVALYPSLLDELRYFSLSRSSARGHTTLDKARYDVWESVATGTFEFFGASFVALALDLCRYSDVEDAAIQVEWYGTDCFWNRRVLDHLLSHFLYGRVRQNERISVDLDAITLELCEVHRQLKLHHDSASSPQHELVEVPRHDVFDVTEPLCQLFYTWLSVANSSERSKAMEVLKNVLCETRIGDADEQPPMKLPLPPQLADQLPVDLAMTFALNSNKENLMKPLSSAGLQQLESWLSLRMGTVHQADSVFATATASLPASLIRKLIQDIKAAGSEGLQVGRPLTSSGFDMLLAKMELNSSILELNCETGVMARLFHSWLRCRGGQFKHKLMVDQINEEYARMGWPPCKNSSLLQEVRSTLSSNGLFSLEQARTRCDIWLRSVPEFLRRLKYESSFVNFVAAVSMEDIDPGDSSCISMELAEQIRRNAVAGRYHLFKPLLAEDESAASLVVIYLVEELWYWKCGDIYSDFVEFGVDSYDDWLPAYSSADFPSVRLPGPTPQYFSSLKFLTADPKAFQSLVYCSYLHRRSGLVEASQQDLEDLGRTIKPHEINDKLASDFWEQARLTEVSNMPDS